ncbi:flagellar hook-associated protein FlgL [Catenovulum sp. 2E275]|uniref:flagellar hook-associated protein FlgL n=1 Tax=Catenovulum sp. 2E275 TaxID=2980497 RepID=UPI0021CF9815|nr:flagellar hook-associated protein FlgL [Catenovulum sp. 2E275]MCU4676427.1 flagellar hook-associated protein FlgL [Catenovulum sp. 2E275]
MRLTTNMIYSRNLDGILESQKRLVRANDVLNQQTNILKPSDDPTGATKVVRFDEDLARLEQFSKNNISVKNSLSQQETIMTNINESLTKANSLVIQAGNGALGYADRKAIATEISLIKDEVLDLMNSKNAQGEYIFAGAKSDQPPFVLNSAGEFVYQGDENVKKVQVSETLKLDVGVPGSGLAIFEDTSARSSVSLNASSTASGDYRLADGDSFDKFHKQNYVQIPPHPAGSNDYRVILGAGTYQVEDSSGTVLQSGDYADGDKINFKGLEFDISGTAGQSIDFTLDSPNKKNILNALTEMVNMIQNSETVGDAYSDKIQQTLYSLEQAQGNLGEARSEIGGRVNVLDSVKLSNTDQEINIKEAKANVSEADLAEAITELQKQEVAYQVSSQTFTKLSGLSLFNFL